MILTTASKPPRRFVDQRRNQTTVTRQSAPARITILPRAPVELSQLPLETATSTISPAPQQKLLSSTGPLLTSAKRVDRGRRTSTAETESSDSSGNESDSSYNSFMLCQKKKELLRLDSTSSIADSFRRTDSSRSSSPNPSFGESNGNKASVYRVIRSHYEGDLFRNSRLTAQLIVAPERINQTGPVKSLFKWVHLENPSMNFGKFMEYVAKCPHLDDVERDNVTSILRTAREKSDRSLRMPNGVSGSYIEPEYFEEIIESTVYQGPRSKRSRKETVRWMAIPYFYFPPTSAEFNKGYSDGKSRNHQQLLSHGCISGGSLFQIAELWCLILGDNFMISCSRNSIPETPGSLIHVTHLPPVDPARPISSELSPLLQVSDGGLRLWLLPLDQCQTWPTFVANFIGLGFSLVDGWQVKYRDVVLDVNDWSIVIAMAKRAPMRLELCRKPKIDKKPINTTLSEYDTEAKSSFFNPLTSNNTQTEQIHNPSSTVPVKRPTRPLGRKIWCRDGERVRDIEETQVLDVDEFHVFTLLATVPVQSPGSKLTTTHYRIDEKQLQQDLSDLDEYLSSQNKRQLEGSLYEDCPKKTTYDLEQLISTLEIASDNDYSNIRDFVEALGIIFELFIPLRYEHPVTLKFWGSVSRIISTENIRGGRGDFEATVKDLRELAKVANEIRMEIFSGKKLSNFITKVPHEFTQAWMLLEMFLICYTTEESSRCSHHVRRCKNRLCQGRSKIIERLQTVNIREREAVLPLGVTSMILAQLVYDRQGPLTPERHRLTMTYWDFFRSFKQQVHDQPLNRKYETTFSKLKSEFETIISALEDQQRVLIALEDSINEAESHSFAFNSPSPTRISLGQSREASVVGYLLSQTEEMIQNFWEMSRGLNDLEHWHFLCLSIDKDKQDRASLTFTTVTVFFLPLTTLASILGMNTNDIRNMPDNQWVFWAVAIPLCLASLCIWLFYLRSFGRLRWPWAKQHAPQHVPMFVI
ncbi:hypothetical protein B0J11DRAFT_339407 [Dendryphion nanum]|uniref:Uncharacterized protein n=1 Tax=Dendryphion nanum TaxID=256645 RepID=A0A9P9IK80_9PLEO|nr:hypothetical protein B0J11DRAFT_339407 [Dendryphion nanum]